MDAKDQKIQSLEKDVARMKNAMNTFERQLKLMNSRLIRAGEQARRAQQEIDHLKRK
jgi:outer membrane murein-binding lipoprotein Lpp